MEKQIKIINPLSDFITDEVYEAIKPFLDKIAVRDFTIRNTYKELRSKGMRAGDAVDVIRKDYSYLQWESIRKITVAKPKKAS